MPPVLMQPLASQEALVQALVGWARPLAGPTDEDALVRFIARGSLVMIGESTHGTHEFYQLRADLTRRLIAEYGFRAVVIEGDWPDALRVNRHVCGGNEDADADMALAGFRRFPTWMWRNTVVADFVTWLRRYNATAGAGQGAGFYGMDLYSLFGSIQAVLAYLERTDPEAARRARARYACFDHYGQDSHAYGYAASFGLQPHCEDEALAQLREMNRRAAAQVRAAGRAWDEAFIAQQNARLVRNAEEYYRTMFHRMASSWNLRDRHMFDTLEALRRHLARDSQPPRIVVWAHNSHLGDARATDMGLRGESNVGQLARERWGSEVVLVGLTSFQGTVTAAAAWDSPAQQRGVRKAWPGSWDELLHQAAVKQPGERLWLPLRDNPALAAPLAQARLQRAIGVVYQPQTERTSHYVQARLGEQFDALVHLDRTRALQPLDPQPPWLEPADEPPETFPSGL